MSSHEEGVMQVAQERGLTVEEWMEFIRLRDIVAIYDQKKANEKYNKEIELKRLKLATQFDDIKEKYPDVYEIYLSMKRKMLGDK